MSHLNLDFRGDFVIADSPDQKSYLLPYWLNDRVNMADRIKQAGAFGQPGAILISPANVIDVRAYIRAENFHRTIQNIELQSNGAISFEKMRATDLVKAGKTQTPLLAVTASLPSTLLPEFCTAAGLEGVRPLKDPHADAVAARLDRHLLEPA